jgi:hypothetical protein
MLRPIWLNNLPTPPSVNASLVPMAQKKRAANGRIYMGARMRPAPEMVTYKDEVRLYRLRHEGKLTAIGRALRNEIEERQWVLRVDVFIVFHVERIFSSVNKKVLTLDANNRIKASLDAVANLLDIDDKYFFRGDCEKVTTAQKESQCTMVRIQLVRPRTHEEIMAVMRQDLDDSPIRTF